MRKNVIIENKGSTLSVVIIAISFLTLLTSMILLVTSMNLQMKLVNSGIKKDTYLAEAAINDIYNRIGQEASACYANAYTDILKTVSQNGISTYQTETEAYEAFCKLFVEELGNLYLSDKSSGEDYTTDEMATLLTNYITELSDQEGMVREVVSIEDIVINYKLSSTGSGMNVPDNFTFKGITLKTTDASGTTTDVTTDIVISMPYTTFFSEHDLFTDYAVIADQGIFIDGNGQTVSIEGNLYAGLGTLGGETEQQNYGMSELGGGLNIRNSIFEFSGAYLVSAGDINIRQSDFSINNENLTTSIWAETLRITNENGQTTSTSGYLNSQIYLSDDMEINASNIEMTMEGAFYGYNNNTVETQDKITEENIDTKSSSLLINGENVDLNLTDLNTLLIAGKGYIDFSSRGISSDATAYATAESLGLITNQTIYYVPQDYLITSNPTTKEEADLLTESPISTEISDWFGYAYLDDDLYTTQEAVVSTGGANVSLVYYYLKFNSEGDKINFVKEVFSATEEKYENETDPAEKEKLYQALKMKEELETRAQYLALKSIQVADDSSAKIYGSGVVLTYSDTADTGNKIGYQENTQIGVDYAYLLTGKLNTRYQWMTQFLEPWEEKAITDSVDEITSADYYSSDVYTADLNLLPLSNYIDTYKLSQAPLSSRTEYDQYSSVVMNGSSTINENIKGIIICNGDLTIDSCTIEGIVLCTGRVTLKNNAVIKNNQSAILQVIKQDLSQAQTITDDEYAELATYYLLNYYETQADLVSESLVIKDNDYTDYMYYENWNN